MLAMHALTWSACKWRRHRSVLCNNLLSRWGVKVYDAGDVIHMYESNSHLWPSMATCKCIPSHGPQHKGVKDADPARPPAPSTLMVMGSIDHPFALRLPSTLFFSKKCHFCDMRLIAVKCKFKQSKWHVIGKNCLNETFDVIHFPQEQEPARGPEQEAFNFAIQNVTQQ